MLIQNNSDSFITKYISIYLKETFNSNIEVSSIYNNSIYNFFNINDNILISEYIAIPIFDDLSDIPSRYAYGFVLGAIGNVVETINLNNGEKWIIEDSDPPTNLPVQPELHLQDGTGTVYFDTKVKLQEDDTLLFVEINGETGELATLDDGKTLITLDIDWNTPIYANKTYCRNCKNLSVYIYQWLKSRYSPLIINDGNYNNITVYYSNIANYFISTNKYFNPNKLAFDIDDLTGSYLFGRTISDISTPDEIEYVQNLLRYNKYLKQSIDFKVYIDTPGKWNNLHNLIYLYQLNLNERYNVTANQNDIINTDANQFNVVIPTGFVDIITEKYLIMEYEGESTYGYYSESGTILHTA